MDFSSFGGGMDGKYRDVGLVEISEIVATLYGFYGGITPLHRV